MDGIPNSANTASPAPAPPKLRTARGQPYVPAVGPRLRVLLAFIFASVAVLGASGVYLVAVRLFEWRRGQTFTNQFTLWMFLAHVLLGVVFILPYVVFGVAHYASARTRKNRLAVKLGIALFI